MADKKKPPPPYDGEGLSMCLPQAFDFANTTAIVVSGDRWNPCGHMLLKVGESVPYYFRKRPAKSRLRQDSQRLWAQSEIRGGVM